MLNLVLANLENTSSPTFLEEQTDVFNLASLSLKCLNVLSDKPADWGHLPYRVE